MKKPILTDDELNEELDNDIAVVTDILKKHPTGYSPMLHVITWDVAKESLAHLLIAMDVDFNNANVKYEALAQLGGVLAEKKFIVLAIVLTSEAWLREPKKNPDGSIGYGEIQDEVVIVDLSTYDKRSAMAVIPLARRDEDNAMIGRFSEVKTVKYDPKNSTRGYQGDLAKNFWKGYALKALDMLEKREKVTEN